MLAGRLRQWLKQPASTSLTCGFVDAEGCLVAQLEARRGERLFDVARRAGLPIASACGGEGMCGRCRIELLDGRTEPLDAGLEAMHACDGSTGKWRLACLQRVESAITCRIPTPAQKVNHDADAVCCSVTGIEEISPGMRRYFLRNAEGQLFAFASGQHVLVQVKADHGAPCWRPYSIIECADPSTGHAEFSIAVRLSTDGPATWGPGTQFFARLRPGATLMLMPARGGLSVHSVKLRPQDLWLLAGGVGIVPLAAMVPDLIANAQVRKVVLWHGANDSAEQSYFADRLMPHMRQPNFEYVRLRPKLPGQRTRSVERVLQQKFDEHQAMGRPAWRQQLQVMACGRPQFVACVRRTLAAQQLAHCLQVEHV